MRAAHRTSERKKSGSRRSRIAFARTHVVDFQGAVCAVQRKIEVCKSSKCTKEKEAGNGQFFKNASRKIVFAPTLVNLKFILALQEEGSPL